MHYKIEMTYSFIHSFIYFESGSMAHKHKTQTHIKDDNLKSVCKLFHITAAETAKSMNKGLMILVV